jgi:choline dehydrogenase-like flavoprotein
MGRISNFDFTANDVWNVFGDPGALWDKVINDRTPSEYNAYILKNYAETVPNAESRVTLSETRNALGQRIAKLDWRLSELDRKGLVEAHRILAHEVGRTQFGRFQNQLPEEQDAILEEGHGGCHHMGTTRMHDDPSHGVVDRNCRVHECSNVYLAGSSVFPCAGWPNPTLTIVALALRLADHLKSEISSHV